jgi:hypothetical protein
LLSISVARALPRCHSDEKLMKNTGFQQASWERICPTFTA